MIPCMYKQSPFTSPRYPLSTSDDRGGAVLNEAAHAGFKPSRPLGDSLAQDRQARHG